MKLMAHKRVASGFKTFDGGILGRFEELNVDSKFTRIISNTYYFCVF